MTNISISVTIASLSPLRNAQNINTSMMYCWIAMYNLTKDLIMIITLISYGQETGARKKHSQALLGELLFYITRQIQNNTWTPANMGRKGEKPF